MEIPKMPPFPKLTMEDTNHITKIVFGTYQNIEKYDSEKILTILHQSTTSLRERQETE